MNSSVTDIRELMRRVRRLQIRSSHRADAVFVGQYRSAIRGAGVEFEEVRPYQPGDDVRRIDWKVTARSRVPYVKLFCEEREQSVHLLVDVSASLEFGASKQTKRDLVAELSTLLVFAAIRNQDRVGLTLFSDRVETAIPPRKGARHALRIVRELIACDPVGRKTDLAAGMTHLQQSAARRSVVFLISDFWDDDFQEPLRRLRGRHDVVAIAVRDRRELELPPVGLLDVIDPETRQRWTLDTSRKASREQFRRLLSEEAEQRRAIFRQLGVDYLELFTGDDPEVALRRFFERRASRR